MKKPSVKKTILRLNGMVQSIGGDSALDGLTGLAGCFALLLDYYAAPNAENPQGMCDDPVAFRQHFCNVIMIAGKDDTL